MTSELLKKEQEYLKLNEELEVRTKKLMQEVDVVMKIQDNLTKDIPIQNTTCTLKQNRKCDPIDLYCTKNIPKLLDTNGCVTNIPECVEDMGVKGMTHFFRAKLKKLQNDYDKLQVEHRTKCDEIKKLQKENQKLLEDKEKWFQISTGHKTHINKLENQLGSSNSKLQSKENENVTLKKEIDQLQKELKNETVNTSNSEVKLKRVLEENEKHKAALKNVKQEEKDLREAHRKQINDLSNIIKKIEKHKIEILNGFKKQLLLIDNLKRQKTLIENYKLTEKADSDFMKILDWKIHN